MGRVPRVKRTRVVRLVAIPIAVVLLWRRLVVVVAPSAESMVDGAACLVTHGQHVVALDAPGAPTATAAALMPQRLLLHKQGTWVAGWGSYGAGSGQGCVFKGKQGASHKSAKTDSALSTQQATDPEHCHSRWACRRP